MELPTISANSVEQFKALSESIQSLPETVRGQIVSIRDNLGFVRCELKRMYGGDNMNIYLPKETIRSMTDNGTYFGVHTDDFYFDIPKESEPFIFNFI